MISHLRALGYNSVVYLDILSLEKTVKKLLESLNETIEILKSLVSLSVIKKANWNHQECVSTWGLL